MDFHWKRQNSSPAAAVVREVLLVLAWFLMIALYGESMRFMTSSKGRKMSWQSRRSLFACLTWSVVYVTVMAASNSVYLFTSYYPGCLARQWVVAVLAMQRLTLYWFFISRLRSAFQGTSFAYAQWVFVSCFSGTGTTVMAALVAYLYLMDLMDCSDEAILVAGAPALLQELFWSTLMCYLFQRRIRSVGGSLSEVSLQPLRRWPHRQMHAFSTGIFSHRRAAPRSC